MRVKRKCRKSLREEGGPVESQRKIRKSVELNKEKKANVESYF